MIFQEHPVVASHVMQARHGAVGVSHGRFYTGLTTVDASPTAPSCLRRADKTRTSGPFYGVSNEPRRRRPGRRPQLRDPAAPVAQRAGFARRRAVLSLRRASRVSPDVRQSSSVVRGRSSPDVGLSQSHGRIVAPIPTPRRAHPDVEQRMRSRGHATSPNVGPSTLRRPDCPGDRRPPGALFRPMSAPLRPDSP
jgi:hypothetical protein